MIVVPDGGRRLSDGHLVEASIVARLLGIRLLTIDARVIVAPARVTEELRGPVAPRTRTRAIGAGLPAAETFLSEGAASLAAARAARRSAR